MSTTNAPHAAGLLDAAKAAHIVAVQRHQETTARWGQARDNHAAASRRREQMLDNAANGHDVNEADLAFATTAKAAAKDAVDLRAALVDGALRNAEENEIVLMHAVVSHHAARVHSARIAAVEAAAVVDDVVADAGAKLAAYQDRLADLRDLGNEAADHSNHVLPSAICRNTILASLHPSQCPRMAAVPVARPALSIAILTDAVAGLIGEQTRVLSSVSVWSSGLAPAPAPATKSRGV